MPSTYNLPRANQQWSEMDINVYNKLPFHLAMLGAKTMPVWHIWDKFFGTRKWQPNMGTVLKGVNAEFSPVGRQMFFPNPITTLPNRDVHETRERTDTAIVYRHNYESPYINFNGPFADFRQKQIPFANNDLTRQVAIANDQFIRTMVLHLSPAVVIAGKGITNAADTFDGGDLVYAPTGLGSLDGTTAKTTAWLQAAASYVGVNKGNLSYKLTKKVCTYLMEDIQAPPFEGMANQPKPNEQVKGKYVVIGSNENYEYFEFDDYVADRNKYTVAAQDADFAGPVGSKSLWKSERFALRMAADGSFPAPQLYETNPNSWNYGETLPNPAYLAAPFELTFFCGCGAYESIDVGPPPTEFANNTMSSKKFASLRWNGEVRLTDNILINIGTVVAPIMTTNKYGEFVQLFADTTHALVPINRRFVLPVLHRRTRVQA